MWEIQIWWMGKWRRLFRGEYGRLLAYQKQCTRVETRIIQVK